MSDHGLQQNPLWQGKRFGRTLPSGDKSIKARLIAERKTKKEGGGRVEKPSIRRNLILLIEYFLKTKRKRKTVVKERYKVGGLRPQKQELESSMFLEGGLRQQ